MRKVQGTASEDASHRPREQRPFWEVLGLRDRGLGSDLGCGLPAVRPWASRLLPSCPFHGAPAWPTLEGTYTDLTRHCPHLYPAHAACACARFPALVPHPGPGSHPPQQSGELVPPQTLGPTLTTGVGASLPLLPHPGGTSLRCGFYMGSEIPTDAGALPSAPSLEMCLHLLINRLLPSPHLHPLLGGLGLGTFSAQHRAGQQPAATSVRRIITP